MKNFICTKRGHSAFSAPKMFSICLAMLNSRFHIIFFVEVILEAVFHPRVGILPTVLFLDRIKKTSTIATLLNHLFFVYLGAIYGVFLAKFLMFAATAIYWAPTTILMARNRLFAVFINLFYSTSSCEICLDHFRKGCLVACCHESPHLICKECFSRMIHVQLKPENRGKFRSRSCTICCCLCSHPFSRFDLQQKSSIPDYDKYIKICSEESEIEQQRILDLNRQREINVQTCTEHIRENILNLKCPQCQAVFIDFDGCFALTCSQCQCHFCAWCFAQCPNSNAAHNHVRQCPQNLNGNELFAKVTLFKKHHKDKRKAMTIEYLQSIQDTEIRNRVRLNITQDLRQIKIRIVESDLMVPP